MKEPKIFVGTMSSGEAELEQCLEAIQRQKHVQVTQRLISGLPEPEAHNLLWYLWNSSKDSHDLFIKVDADTVITDPTKFDKIWETFQSDSRITGIQIPLHDYFTEQPILGLNCFSPVVTFNVTSDRLYCDRVDTGHIIHLKGDAVAHLAPGGLHCVNPHKKQAFHFGLHRMLKNQRDKIKATYKAWQAHHDDARAWALVGAMYTQTDLRNTFHYTDERFNETVDKLKLDKELIQAMIAFCEAL